MSTAPVSQLSSSPRSALRRQPVAVALALGLAALLLSGCAAAPGMYVSAAMGSQGDAPAGALLSITPDLIREQRALQKATLGADVQRLFGEAKPYVIGPADVINIVVWGHPELVLAPAGSTLTTDASGLAAVGNGFNVSPEGLIQFPLLATFKIAGLTENQARDEFTRRLAKFVNNPQVTLRVQAYRAGRVYVDGEVRNPGLQAITDIPMTLPEAISRAGGLTPIGDRASVAVTRNGATTLVSLPQLAELGVNPSRIMLAAGDLVRVGSSDDSKVYVMGEVTRPIAQPLRNGRLTLNQALGEAGGVASISGDPRQIYVVRSRNGGNAANSANGATGDSVPVNAPVSPTMPEIYHLDARSPVAYALAEGFELKARDVVFIDPVPLVRWNRVISLILPSAAVASATRAAVN
jgi:polysaccharide biosynthesis/export protein